MLTYQKTKDSIGFDLDGVLYPWTSIVYDELINHNNLTTPYAEFWIAQSQGKDQFGSIFWENMCSIPIFYSRAKIREEDLETLNELAKRYNLWYITSRPAPVEIATRNWCRREQLPQYENLIITYDKAPEISRLNIVAFTEDRNSNIKKLKDICKVFIYSQPWNMGTDFENTTRIYSIKELLKWI